MKTKKRILDVYDVSRLLGVSVRQLQSLVRQNHIIHIRLPNGDLRFEESDVLDWLTSLKEQRPAKPSPHVDLPTAAAALGLPPEVLTEAAQLLGVPGPPYQGRSHNTRGSDGFAGHVRAAN